MIHINKIKMKSLFFAVALSLATSFSCFGQIVSKKPAKKIGYNKEVSLSKISLTDRIKTQNNDYVITGEHISSVSGIKHIYLRQAINGIEVASTDSSIHLDAFGKAIASHDNFIDNIEATVIHSAKTLNPTQAINKVASYMGYTISNLVMLEKNLQQGEQYLFNKASISGTEIPVKLQYVYIEGKGTSLVWELSVQELTTSDWWVFKVNATNGAIISKENLTISCFTDNHNHDYLDNSKKEPTLFYTVENNPSLMVGSYGVVPLPYESPGHSPNQNVLISVANPDNPNASPFGWHDTNGAPGSEFTRTQGNNCSAYDDDNNTNSASTAADYAEGGASLNFTGFSYSPTYSAGNQSEDAAVTNLFYWTNVIHDVVYQYGFDEASGNFQENNYGNGGSGSDSVNSEAQDGSGTCNANFGTPTDGNNPRMQMYTCGSRDGDFDNGVIIHEYGHGISTRLTGGAGNSSCLNNTEQMGEGWSDYYGLMLTMESGDIGTDSRGIGTWLIGEAPNGPGIRTYPYSTNFAVNPHTYDDIITEVAPHGVGSVWCAMLWEMTWELIGDHGFSTDLYTFTGNAAVDAGNVQALAIVTEALKLQPCSPGFVNGRDAILLADQNIYGGANQCAIWDAFARRGLGYSASQGSTSSKTDGTEAFDLPPGTAQFNNSIADVCVTAGVQTGLSGGSPSGGTYSGTGVTDDGNGLSYTFDPSAAGVGTSTVTYTVIDACTGGIVNLDETITVTSGIPDLVCQDVLVTLDGTGNASIIWNDVVANTIPGEYLYDDSNGTLPYAPSTLTGAATTVSLGDDTGTTAIPIGFDFEFYDSLFSNFYIASNGFVSFTGTGMTGAASRTPTTLPNAGIPNGIIAGAWDDLDPSAGGTIRHQLFGTSPNRIRVVEFNAVRYWNATQTVSFQIHLKEGSNAIEIHLIDIQTDGGVRTNGIENSAGNDADFNPVANLGNWTASNFAIGFTPQPDSFAENCGNTVNLSLSESNFTCSDVGVNSITVTADDGNGGVNTCSANVTVVGETTIYSGGTWDNGIPDLGKNARFSQNYNTSIANINACSCEVDAGSTVTVAPNTYMNVNGNITINGNLTVAHQGSLVQVDDAATVTNNGTINVNVTTPDLRKRDFMLLGSPMTGELRTGVYNSSFLVLEFLPENFMPHPDVPAGGTNWADDNGDFYRQLAAGPINAGEGYVVRPQSGYNDPTVPPAGRPFNFTYELGTLNNGDITYTNYNNGPSNPNGTPNVVANPYACAIDADLFLTENPVGELYFWEHLTPPGTPLTGTNLRYDMNDISIYDGTIGLPAANDPGNTMGTAPNGIIASTQGFGIRTVGGAGTTGTITFNNGMRLTSGNTTLRTTNLATEKIILEVRENTYGYGAFMGIAFAGNASEEANKGKNTNRLATTVSLYSHLDNGSEQLAIQTRGAFHTGTKIPLGFTSQIDELLEYEISITNIEGNNLSEASVYLWDNENKTLANLNDGPYAFKSMAATFDERFVLLFSGDSYRGITLGTNENSLEEIAVFPNPTDGLLNIVSINMEIEQVTVFDIQGREVVSSIEKGMTVRVDISQLKTSVYFVKIDTKDGTITKRIVKK
jgi:hypothetical protein